MTTFKARALVLREYEAGESDKRIVLFCKDHGKLMVYARGARKVKSKFLAASQMLTYGDYVLADGGKFISMSQGSVIESFYNISRDYDLLRYAQYILDICYKAVPDRTNCDELLRLALKALQYINSQNIYSKKSDIDSKKFDTSRQSVIVFLFRFFLFYGLKPEMDTCCACGGGLDLNNENNEAMILFCDEGLVCGDCRNSLNKVKMPLSPSAREAIRHILKSDLKHAFMFEVKEPVLDEVGRAADLCMRGHFAHLQCLEETIK